MLSRRLIKGNRIRNNSDFSGSASSVVFSSLLTWQNISLLVSFFILITACGGLFGWLGHFVFNEPREDMAHGWFVPIFSFVLLWMKRDDLKKSISCPSFFGYLLTLVGVLLFFVGELGEQVRFTQLGAIWLAGTIFYTVFGKKFAYVAAFPVAFLLFTVPLGFLDIVTVKLRVIISAVASLLLNGAGIPVLRTGTGLQCLSGEGFSLDIADPCSGLRSIFALAALTAAYSYLNQKTTRGKISLFLCAVPVAMLGNLARIISIAVVACLFGQKAATGFYHDYSGYVVFVVALMFVIGLGNFFSKLFKKYENNKPEKDTPEHIGTDNVAAPRVRPRLRDFIVLILLPVTLLSMKVIIKNAPSPTLEGSDFVTDSLKPLPGYSMRIPYFCQNEQCQNLTEAFDGEVFTAKCSKCGSVMDSVSLAEKNILPEDTTFLKANYYDSMGDAWRVSVIVNGKSRLSIHRPEICLPAQGMSIEEGKVESFKLSNGLKLDMHCMVVRPRTSTSKIRMGHGYLFVSAHDMAASHLKRILIAVRDRVLFRRITRWSMVTVSSEESFTSNSERKEATGAFLSELMPTLFNKGKNGKGLYD